jgi:hypothetical protein
MLNHHLQQPHSHIPLYEADYEKMKKTASMKKEESTSRMIGRRLISSMLSGSSRLVLPAKPEVRKTHVEYLSVSPFDTRFPMFAKTPELKMPLFSVSPFDSDFPHYLNRSTSKQSEKKQITLDSNDVEDPDFKSFSPFQQGFPHSKHHGRHRKSRNRSSIKKRKLVAAMKDYRRERGPASERPLLKEKASAIYEGSVISFSPWQSVEFCEACDLPIQKLVKDYKKLVQQKQMQKHLAKKAKKSFRFISYSPFDARFPLGVIQQPQQQLVVKVNAFPAYSPMAKKVTPADFKMPPAVASPAPAVATTQRKVLHMH